MIIIRKAKIKDLSQVVKLYIEYMHYHEKLDPALEIKNNPQRDALEYLRKHIYSPKKLLLVAEDKDKVVGFLAAYAFEMLPIYKNKYGGFISDVFVDSKIRRQGISGNLLEESFKWFRGKKINRVELGMLANNDLAIKTWKAHGFKDVFYRKRKII